MQCKFGWMLLLTAPALLATPDWETHFANAENLERAGRYERAAAEFEAALRDAAGLQAPMTWNNLGVVYRALDRPRDAERCYRKALAFYEARPDLAVPLATTLENLAALQLTLGRLTQAEPLYRRAYEIRRANLPAGHPAIAQSLQGLARLAQERHRPLEAERYYREALAIRESAPVLHNLATLLVENTRFDEARVLYGRALTIYREHPGHPAEAVVLRYLAELDARQGDLARSEKEFQDALAICERALPPDHPQTGVILQAYGLFLQQSHRKKEAAAVSARANRILAKAALATGAAYTVEANLLAGQ